MFPPRHRFVPFVQAHHDHLDVSRLLMNPDLPVALIAPSMVATISSYSLMVWRSAPPHVVEFLLANVLEVHTDQVIVAQQSNLKACHPNPWWTYFESVARNPYPSAERILLDNWDHFVLGDHHVSLRKTLSANPARWATKLLSQRPELIHWAGLASNPSLDAIDLLRANEAHIDWFVLNDNGSPCAICFLCDHFPHQLVMDRLAENMAALPTVRDIPECAVDKCIERWDELSFHGMHFLLAIPHARLFAHFADHITTYDVGYFRNPLPQAIRYVSQRIGQTQDTPPAFGSNPGPDALPILRQWADMTAPLVPPSDDQDDDSDEDEAMWDNLCENANPDVLRDVVYPRPRRINWAMLSRNSAIFEYDYAAMYAQATAFRAELLRNRMHPKHLHRLADWGLYLN
jgi:hypothetical protein